MAERAVDRCVQPLRGYVVRLGENPRFGATETAAMGWHRYKQAFANSLTAMRSSLNNNNLNQDFYWDETEVSCLARD